MSQSLFWTKFHVGKSTVTGVINSCPTDLAIYHTEHPALCTARWAWRSTLCRSICGSWYLLDITVVCSGQAMNEITSALSLVSSSVLALGSWMWRSLFPSVGRRNTTTSTFHGSLLIHECYQCMKSGGALGLVFGTLSARIDLFFFLTFSRRWFLFYFGYLFCQSLHTDSWCFLLRASGLQ